MNVLKTENIVHEHVHVLRYRYITEKWDETDASKVDIDDSLNKLSNFV